MKLTGIVVKGDSLNSSRYYVCTGTNVVLVESIEEMEESEAVELTGEYTSYLFKATGVEKIVDKSLEKKVRHFLLYKSPEFETLIDAPSLTKMRTVFEKAAEVIGNAVLELRTIKIRYDGDCDGILAGLMLKKAVEKFASNKGVPLFLRCQESGGAIYRERDSEEDCATLPDNALFILLDHGANQESKAPLCAVAKKAEVMVVDHHPPADKHCIKHFVSPFVLKGCEEPSSYNTGMLAFEISRRLAPELEAQLLPYRYYSMQGDTSSYRKAEFFQEAVIVDYLAVKASDPYQLEFYEKTLGDKNLVKELYREEQLKMQAAFQRAIEKAKTTQGKFLFVTCDVSGLVKKNSYPSLGKLHNAVQTHFAMQSGAEKPTVSILYTRENLSFRATHSASELGFSANKIIAVLRGEYGQHGFTGGGHNVAASTRFPKEYGKEVVATTVKMVNQINE